MSKAGLRLNTLAKDRKAIYDGPALDDLTKLTVEERRLVKWKLSLIYTPDEEKRTGTGAGARDLRGPLRWSEEAGRPGACAA